MYVAMNAGKTTVLLQSAFNYNERGMKTLLFTPSVDTRYGEGIICSRIGLQEKAVVFDHGYDFTGIKNVKEYNCLMIDEAQFLTKEQVGQLCNIVDVFGVPVLAYGLRNDFKGEPFEGSKYLLAWADELVEIKTICHCGKKATFNIRHSLTGKMIEEGEQILIGDDSCYSSVCRKHYFSKQPFRVTEENKIEFRVVDLEDGKSLKKL